MYYYKRTTDGQWRWAVVASNGQMSSSHEKHPTRSNAKRAAYKNAMHAVNQILVRLPGVTPGFKIKTLKEFVMKEWSERPGAKKKKK